LRRTCRRGPAASRPEELVVGGIRLADDGRHHVVVPAVRVIVGDDHRGLAPFRPRLQAVDRADDEALLGQRIGISGLAILEGARLEEADRRQAERAVPQKHPLRKLKELADTALRELSAVFDEMYSAIGRPSIPPERLLKSTLLMAFYSVRSETLFCEQLDYNLLFRWFLDMNLEEKCFVQETFSKNRERLMKHHVASAFFGLVSSRRAERG